MLDKAHYCGFCMASSVLDVDTETMVQVGWSDRCEMAKVGLAAGQLSKANGCYGGGFRLRQEM